jgi:hypothetical protein
MQRLISSFKAIAEDGEARARNQPLAFALGDGRALFSGEHRPLACRIRPLRRMQLARSATTISQFA